MKILVINAGSSSLKFQLINMANKKVLAKGNVERIGESQPFLRYKAHGKEQSFNADIPNHTVAMAMVLEKLTDKEIGVVGDLSEINGFGHRIVNVGEKYFDPIIVTKEILEDFKTKVDFSPLHVPGAIAGIEGAMAVSPNTPNVAVFDIGFHKTMPKYAYLYAIPKRYYENYRIRRYGAHGTSHYYVANECAKMMGKKIKDTKIITCHIGGGASVAAVKGGKCIDTSMGFTPLEGVIMNTRCGDLDNAVVEFICNKEKRSVQDVLKMLNKESGLLGLTGGRMSDMRDITANLDDEEVRLAFEAYCYRIKKYIGAYAAALNGVDAIVFTAGCGEHTPELRELACSGLDYLGVKIDKKRNWNLPRGEASEISAKSSKVKVFVIPTDEEMVIAKETQKLLKNQK